MIGIDCPIIKKLVEHDIEVVIKSNGFQVNGFYKSGSVLLVRQYDGDLRYLAVARYDEKTEIREIGDLAALNLKWFSRWIESGNPGTMNPGWESLLVDLGLVKIETKTLKEYKLYP